MFSCREALIGAALAALACAATAQSAARTASFPGIGRAATPQEIRAWDIDVRPDFKGLPPGRGSVAQGQVIWEAQCASCHGVFGESNEVFTPLVGGTTAADIQTGRVARLTDASFPGRTTFMKLPTLSTLWDYIHRAMPWNAPKSLKHDEVYAVTAFMLNLAGVVPDDFTLSDQNMRQVQQRLPNRNGMTTDHAMWPGRGWGGSRKPDVSGVACMANCAPEPQVASFLPDFARNAHGNLADQNRLVGPQRGVVTAEEAAKSAATAIHPAHQLAQKHNCLTCHGVENRVVGPSMREIAGKHGARSDAVSYLSGKIVEGGSGVWGAIPMPAQTLPSEDAKAIAQWLVTLAKP